MRNPDSLTDLETARLAALAANEQRRSQGLPCFHVDIVKDGALADSQAVYAADERQARTLAMMQTPARFRGEVVTYEVRTVASGS